MQVATNVSLQPFNTLAAPSTADYFLQIDALEDIDQALSWARQHDCTISIIGGGSNVLLCERIEGLTLRIHLLGKDILSGSDTEARVRVGAGENWHDFVVWCLARQFYGLENLALIPGTVGAAPVQNIGAYGVEVAQFIERVEGVSQWSGKPFSLAANECGFAYRDSRFKQDDSEPLMITHVVFRLPRRFVPNLQYPALADEMEGYPLSAPNIFAAVCHIRSAKLPDPAQLPNCGSFFKNPIVSQERFQRLLAVYPQMPSFSLGATPSSSTYYRKLAAAWLIEQAGWRGKTRFGVSVHQGQALVLTNANRRPAAAMLALARDIQASVVQQFGVQLELEPQVLGA